MEKKVNNMVQPKLARFMNRPSELTVQDLEVATVQALKIKHQMHMQLLF